MSPILRRIGIVLLIALVLLLTAGFLFARFWLDGYLKDEIIQRVAKAEGDMYALQIDQLHVNVFTGKVKMSGVQFQTDSLHWAQFREANPAKSPLRVNVNINTLFVRRFDWVGFWRNKVLEMRSIEIVEPEIKIEARKDTILPETTYTRQGKAGLLEGIPQLLAPHAKSLHIGWIAVRNGKAVFQTTRLDRHSYQQADSIDGTLTNLNIVPGDTSTTHKALFSESILLKFRNYEYYPPGGLYAYRANAGTVSSQDESLRLETVSMLTRISDQEFMQRQKVRISRVKIRAEALVVRKLNLFAALHLQAWDMQSVAIERANFNIYQNKNLPLKLDKKMPNEMFRNIKNYLNIDTVFVRSSNIVYKEVLEDDKGFLNFEKVNAVLLNVSNDTTKMSDATPARLYAAGELMGAGQLDLTLNLPLLANTFRCNYVCTLGKIDMTYLNRLIEDKNHIRIDAGNAEKITLRATVHNGLAQGTLEASYSDLKISLLREGDGSKKKLMSTLANIVLRGKNDRDLDKPFKIGKVNYQREPGDGILRFMWRSAMGGLMETLVPGNIKLGKTE